MNKKSILIGISQRVVQSELYTERRDVLDQAWSHFMNECGFDFVPIPNNHSNPVTYLKKLGISALILSGGGNVSNKLMTCSDQKTKVPLDLLDIAPERDILEHKLLKESLKSGWPVIGVCRGMQVINLFHGGYIEQLPGHSGTNHSLFIKTTKDGNKIFDLQVNSYHDLGIPVHGLGQGLKEIALSGSYVEAFIHDKYLHAGIMWHPERNNSWSKRDITFFKDFLHAKSTNCFRSLK